MPYIKKIGLTGGVASGKSCVAELFQRSGIHSFNLDTIGKNLSDNDPLLAREIEKACGEQVIFGGKLDRAKVREILFSNPQTKQRIESVLHPLIWNEFERMANSAEQKGEKIVLCEAALLVETGLHKKLDGLIVVSASEEQRKERVMSRDRINTLLAEKMIRSQAAEADKRSSATWVIENTGSFSDLELRVHEILSQWRENGWL